MGIALAIVIYAAAFSGACWIYENIEEPSETIEKVQVETFQNKD